MRLTSPNGTPGTSLPVCGFVGRRRSGQQRQQGQERAGRGDDARTPGGPKRRARALAPHSPPQQLEHHEREQDVGRHLLCARADADDDARPRSAGPAGTAPPPRPSRRPRRCRASRSGRGRAAGCRPPSAPPLRARSISLRPPPGRARTSRVSPPCPSSTLGKRQANGPSPNSSIPPAMISLASGGCSEFGSAPSGEFAYGTPGRRRNPGRSRAPR